MKIRHLSASIAMVAALALSPLASSSDLTPANTRAIAEEGFVYGLPLVMNYAVMYEYAVDKDSSQFKAPFNQIHNMTHVATPADKAIVSPNSDTPPRRTNGPHRACG